MSTTAPTVPPTRLTPPPFPVQLELPGWDLVWARLALAEGGTPDLAELRRESAELARGEFDAEALAANQVVTSLRRLFRAAGCDPTRYRPSSEALLRRVLKGEELPAIHPFVDLNNCLSILLAVPSCIMAEGTVAPPYVLRAGRAGEEYLSLRGPFNLEGKPLLADPEGPFGTPITDSERVKVQEGTRAAWLVAYLPAGVVDPDATRRTLEELTEKASGVRLDGVYVVSG
jgi:DNA/RNA-binding domain of Phe-tRNA-synthetase-like protein